MTDRITTFYIHAEEEVKQDASKGVIDLIVMRDMRSLVAWYPSLGEDGLQGCYVTDADVVRVRGTADEIQVLLTNLGIISTITIRSISND